MITRSFNVLVLCTGNSARSILGEALLNHLGAGRVRAFSAGSKPAGKVNPVALETLEKHGIRIEDARSKSWDEFATPGAPRIDFVFTVCANAANEPCPIWPGHPTTAHWAIPDPAHIEPLDARRTAFEIAYRRLERRVRAFLVLPLETMNVEDIKRAAREIHNADETTPQERRPRRDGFLFPQTIAARTPLLQQGHTMNLFERYLTLWVLLCIVAGIGFGHLVPGVFQTIGALEVAHINLPVAVLIWLMIIPMLVKIDLKALKGVTQHWRGVGVTLFVNWAVKPFSMALLAWLLIGGIFRPYLPADQIDSYIAGLILLAAAPCTAMVFVWSNLSHGEPHFTLSQVALNDVIMIFAFAPIVGLLLGLSAITVPWDTLFLSVLLYIVVPLVIANLWRRWLLRDADGESRLRHALKTLQPLSLGALLATLVLLFGFQGDQIIKQPLVIALLAVPILIQVLFSSGLAYLLNRAVRSPHCVAGPSALIGASNFFELAVATAIVLFGFHSGAALATVVGVLIEVPVMLAAVRVVNHTRDWYERRRGVVPQAQCCPWDKTARSTL